MLPEMQPEGHEAKDFSPGSDFCAVSGYDWVMATSGTGSARGLVEAFGLQKGDLAALVGGGGKSSLMFALGKAFPGPVALTTTTRIFTRQMRLAPALALESVDADAGLERLRQLVSRHRLCLVVGSVTGEKAAGVPLDLPRRWLEAGVVELVVVEADGSRRLPIKAPAEYEPVIPPSTTMLIPVVGVDALGRPALQSAHRPELVGRLTGLDPALPLTAEAVARLLLHPAGGLKGLPAGARCVPCINKVETDAGLDAARRIARLLLAEARIERVVITALRRKEPVREVVYRSG